MLVLVVLVLGVPTYAALSVAAWRGMGGPNRTRLALTWIGVTVFIVGFLAGLWYLKALGAVALVLALFSARSTTWGRA